MYMVSSFHSSTISIASRAPPSCARQIRSLLLVFQPCPLERGLDVAPDVAERHAAARVDRHVALARPVVVVEQRAVAHTAAGPLRMVGDPDLDRIVALAELDVGRADAEPPVAGVVGADAAPREPKRLLPRGGTDESHLLDDRDQPVPPLLCLLPGRRHLRLHGGSVDRLLVRGWDLAGAVPRPALHRPLMRPAPLHAGGGA